VKTGFFSLPVKRPSGCSSGVERYLAKVNVEGSNPFIRSIFPDPARSHAGFFMPAAQGIAAGGSIFFRVPKYSRRGG